MVCISTVCGSILDDYFSARGIIAICQVLCTMPTFVSHFRGLMVHEALQICVVPTMKTFLSYTGIYVAVPQFRMATAIYRTSPFATKKKRFSFRYVVQSGQNNIFTYRFRCEYLIRFRSCCEVIAFVLRVGTPAACRMRPGWKHTRYRGLHFSAWHQLAHQGSVSIKEDQKRSGNRCRSINNIRKRISNGKQRFSRKSDPSTEYDIIRDGG